MIGNGIVPCEDAVDGSNRQPAARATRVGKPPPASRMAAHSRDMARQRVGTQRRIVRPRKL